MKITEKKLTFLCLCLGCTTISFNVAAIAAAIPAISLDMGARGILVSRVIPYYMIPYGLGALVYAPLAKRVSLKMILAISIGLYAVSSLYCAMANSLGQLLFARVISGLTGASAIPLGLIIIGKLFTKDVRGRRVGLFFSCSFIASIAGIIASGIIHWRWLFSIPALLGAVTVICIFLFISDSVKNIRINRVSYINAFRDIRIRNIFFFIIVISFLWHGVRNWMGIYLHQVYSFDQLTISFYFVIMALSGAAGQIIGGYLADKRGRVYACNSGLKILAVSTILLCGIFPPILLALLLMGLQLGWTIGHNGVSTILTDFPDEYRPEIASLNSSVRFISGGIGFFISSFFVEQSFAITFLVFGLVMAALSFFLKKIIPEV